MTRSTRLVLKAMQGVETAYYLVHSMGAGGDFEDKDRWRPGISERPREPPE